MNWYENFFVTGPLPSDVVEGTYNLYLVSLSYIIASFASYVALDMSSHLRKPMTLLFRVVWLVSGALVMGAGIWSMHFVGMLSFIMPMKMSYNLFLTVLSLGVAVFVSLIAFLLFSIKKPKLKHYLIGGVLLGIAIPSMHYTGMAAMEGVVIHYYLGLFCLSILIAIVAAMAAVWLALHSDTGIFWTRVRLQFGSGLIMGLAIVGMHYMGMYAAVFTPSPIMNHKIVPIDHTMLIISITVVVLSIMTAALATSISKYFLDLYLKNKNYFLETVLNNMTGGVIACDAKGTLSLLNKTVQEMYKNKLRNNLPLKNWETLFPLYNSNFSRRLTLQEYPLYRALHGEFVKAAEIVIKDSTGAKHTLLVDGQPLRGEAGENLGAVIVFNDISKRKIDEEELKYRATHDMLTGLANRTLLLDRLNQAINSAKRYKLKATVIFIDLDNFKVINDALGHTIGDSLLRMVAARFTLLLRSTDTLARIGGDEFVIVLPDQNNISDVPSFLKRILESISEPYLIDEHEFNITCSIGFSVYPDNGQDVESLLKNADVAMYQAKEQGKNAFQLYTGEMNTQVRKRFELETDLRRGLINNELILHYQPKLDIKTDKLVGFEALIRWNHPKHGIISPNEFIPIAEDTGLILSIGEWVIKTACQQNKDWQDAGFEPLVMSVNLSARQCRDKNLFKIVTSVLEKTKLSPEYLELELTESIAMSNPHKFIELLSKFRKLGIKISIDDFGTGYSSLNYLRQFPVDTLKIDKSFIEKLDSNEDDDSIVKAIVSLGHTLKMNVIAEGVETREQLVHLQENDCDEIQGYYLSRPTSGIEMTAFLKKHKIYAHKQPKTVKKERKKFFSSRVKTIQNEV